jgi:hypothetical protein
VLTGSDVRLGSGSGVDEGVSVGTVASGRAMSGVGVAVGAGVGKGVLVAMTLEVAVITKTVGGGAEKTLQPARRPATRQRLIRWLFNMRPSRYVDLCDKTAVQCRIITHQRGSAYSSILLFQQGHDALVVANPVAFAAHSLVNLDV